MGRPRIPLAVKIEQGVDRSAGPYECWPWKRHCHPETGHGNLSYIDEDGKRRAIIASRAAWAVAHGEMPPPEVFILHHCDNPPCCNPLHLYPGDQVDNMRDRIEHGAGYPERLRLIPPEVQAAMRADYRPGVKGYGQHALAARYGVSRSQVQRIVTAAA